MNGFAVKLLLMLIVLLGVNLSAANAAFLGFTDVSGFRNALAGYDIRTEDFESYLYSPLPNDLNFDGMHISNGFNSKTFMGGWYGPATSGHISLGPSDPNAFYFDFQFDNPVHAFGLQLITHFRNRVPPHAFYLETNVGGLVNGSPVSLNPDYRSCFLGLVSDTPFSSVRIHNMMPGIEFWIDDMSRAWAKDPGPAPVPEPGTTVLLVMGIAVLAGARRGALRVKND